MPFDPWTVQDEETLFENRWVRVRRQQVELPDGRAYDYTLVDRPSQGVGIILLDDAGRLLLEREYRHAVGQVVWQLPGGLIDEGESPLESAQRELLEETGFEAEEWDDLGEFFDNPGLGNAASRLFLARHPHNSARPEWDEAEAVELHWVTFDWLRGAIQRGEIVDRVVLGAVAMLWARELIP